MGDMYKLKNGPGPLGQGAAETANARDGQSSKGSGAALRDVRRPDRTSTGSATTGGSHHAPSSAGDPGC